jgi:hypothetical protein
MQGNFLTTFSRTLLNGVSKFVELSQIHQCKFIQVDMCAVNGAACSLYTQFYVLEIIGLDDRFKKRSSNELFAFVGSTVTAET